VAFLVAAPAASVTPATVALDLPRTEFAVDTDLIEELKIHTRHQFQGHPERQYSHFGPSFHSSKRCNDISTTTNGPLCIVWPPQKHTPVTCTSSACGRKKVKSSIITLSPILQLCCSINRLEHQYPSTHRSASYMLPRDKRTPSSTLSEPMRKLQESVHHHVTYPHVAQIASEYHRATLSVVFGWSRQSNLSGTTAPSFCVIFSSLSDFRFNGQQEPL
jgi:hypothetical protein